jgi:hypothetical protein
MPNQKASAADALFEIIEQQQGYFTAKQAAEAGYRLGSQAHHVKAGNWLRVERGIYRLARFPGSMEEQYVIYSLWSRNRAGEPVGVYSHETALSIHELSDANPARLHMTVPPSFRRTPSRPKVVLLHRARLGSSEIEQRQGFAVTKAIRAVADVAAAGKQEFAEQALREGTKRGVVTRLRNPQNPKKPGICYTHITHSKPLPTRGLQGPRPNTKSGCYAGVYASRPI